MMLEGFFFPLRHVPPPQPPVDQAVAQAPDSSFLILSVSITEIGFLVLGIVNIKNGKTQNDGLTIAIGSVFLAAASCIFICVTAIAIKSCLDRKRAAAPAVSSDYTALNA